MEKDHTHENASMRSYNLMFEKNDYLLVITISIFVFIFLECLFNGWNFNCTLNKRYYKLTFGNSKM